MKRRKILLCGGQNSEKSDNESKRAVSHLINVVKQVRSECAAIATCIVDAHKIDLRPLFIALHKVEESGIDNPSSKPIYRRSEVLQMTGWSRTTLWRKCDDLGLPGRKRAFTQAELEKLVQWDTT